MRRAARGPNRRPSAGACRRRPIRCGVPRLCGGVGRYRPGPAGASRLSAARPPACRWPLGARPAGRI